MTQRILLSGSGVTSLLLPTSAPHSATTSQNTHDVLVNPAQNGSANGTALSGKETSGSTSSAPEIRVDGSGHTGSSKSGLTRIAPETSSSPSGGPTSVTGLQIVWEPVSGGDYLWSDRYNWSNHAVPVNGAGAVFTGQYNEKCIVDENTTEGEIILTDGPGGIPFNAPIEIEGGDALNIPAYDDSSDTGGTYNVVFLAANAAEDYNGNVKLQNDNYTMGTGGKVNILGAARK